MDASFSNGSASVEDFLRLSEGINFNKNLPIYQRREEIVRSIRENQVVLVHGATGCGKTTQIPQYILNDGLQRGNPPYIVVTQPRRIAAQGIARFVSQEMGFELGTVVGYQIGQDSAFSKRDTRILYCTIGTFLQQLIHKEDFSHITHIILDEVHEREEEMDFALLLLHMELRKREKLCFFKLVVMSATMQMDQLREYFWNPPVIAVDTRMFPVEVRYLGRGISMAENFNEFLLDEALIQPVIMRKIVSCVQNLDETEELDSPRGSVLIFVPGFHEIRYLIDKLQNAKRELNWEILPLHSQVATQDQRRIFLPKSPTVRRIIVATNIAESSITVPDVKYIFDLCMTKQVERSENCGFLGLRRTWASKSSCEQRKGRAGRVSAGICFRFVTEEFYDSLRDHNLPEILRVPLHRVILRLKKLKLEKDIYEILSEAMDAPKKEEVEKSMLELMQAEAITVIAEPEKLPDGDLTPFGEIMSQLPLDINLCRLVIIAVSFGFVEEGIIAAACLSVRNFLDAGFMGLEMQRYKMKMNWDRGQHSDPLAALSAFQSWECFSKSANPSEKRDWCAKYSINFNRIIEVNLLVDELRERVENLGLRFVRHHKKFSTWDVESDLDVNLAMQIVLAGAFYPNYFLSSINHDFQLGKNQKSADAAKCINLQTRVNHDAMVSKIGVKVFFKSKIQFEPEDVKVKDGHITAHFACEEPNRDVPLAVYMALKLRETEFENVIIPPPTDFIPRSAQQEIDPRIPKPVALSFEGPFSPMEIRNFNGVTVETEMKNVRIERWSVNSIVVNACEELRIPRMIIAGSVGINEKESRLVLDDTTLLTAKPGLTGLICLLFAPNVTLIRLDNTNESKLAEIPEEFRTGECFVGMRGNLAKPKNVRRFREQEARSRSTQLKATRMTMFFDTIFTKEHLHYVALLRVSMKSCFSTELMENIAWRQEIFPRFRKSSRGVLNHLLQINFPFVSPAENKTCLRVEGKEGEIEFAELFLNELLPVSGFY